MSFVQQAHSLEPRYSWSAGADWFAAAWTVRPAGGNGGFTYAIEFSCALWDTYGPTSGESVRHSFAAGQVIHLAARAADADGGPPASAERYLTYQLGGNLHEDRHAGHMADFILVDSPSDYGSVSGQVTYPDDGSPRANVLVFLQGGMDRMRTFTDEDGRYQFQSACRVLTRSTPAVPSVPGSPWMCQVESP